MLKKKIRDKKHEFNSICLPDSELNQDGGMQLQLIFNNINKLLIF